MMFGKLFLVLFLFFSSCTSIFYTKDFWWSVEVKNGASSPIALTPIIGTIPPTSLYPTFTAFPTQNSFPSPTREIYVSVTSPPVFLTSTPSPSPTISTCAGVVTDSLSKRKSPSLSSSRVGGLVRGQVIQFTEYSVDRKWLHLVDGSWAKIKNDASPFNLYLDIGSC